MRVTGLKPAIEAAEEFRPILRYLLTPFAVAGYTLAAWRFGADIGWTREFFVSQGLFSHWQVWLAMAIFTQVSRIYLDRSTTIAQ